MEHLDLQRSSVSFTLRGPDGELGTVDIGVPGLHNARNGAIAIVAALQVGAPFAAAQAALARFAGVTRRFEFRGEADGVTFVDDYAHLPAEVRAALATARTGGWDRVVAVFQPHRFSRTAALATEFGTAFADADVLVVTDIYSAGERAVPGRVGPPGGRRRPGPGPAASRHLRGGLGGAAPGRAPPSCGRATSASPWARAT